MFFHFVPHDMSDGHTASDRPDWWLENARIRETMDLPKYEPTRFSDGTYLHEVVSALEAEYDCKIRLFAVNPKYPDKWHVRVNGQQVMDIERTKDGKGNTVYETTAEAFESKLRSRLEEME